MKAQESPKKKDGTTSSYCKLMSVPPRPLAPDVVGMRASMILMSRNKWANGTKLKYYFFNGSNDGSPSTWKGTKAQMDVVRAAFAAWKNVGIGLEFTETSDKNEAEIRIGFMRGDGSWSYLGRDIIDFVPSPDERTMNFGWDISNEIDTAIHEIGHTLGAPHEHQNPFAGIVWDEEAVYAALAAPPNNWSRETTFHNIIRKLNPQEVEGSTHDPNSVMHYPFGPGLILEPEGFRNGIFPAGGLSAKDKEFVAKFYPPFPKNDEVEMTLGKSEILNIEAGGQKNFIFKPKISKRYKIETFGQMDTVMVLLERTATDDIYMAGDDDSGTWFNSKLHIRLIKGREYVIRLRLYYAESHGSGSIMVY
ncbi:astacin (peptidase family M12A) [Dyadobacter jejuensis]|uniref:Astacin (Peptidase family M12A) n=1 Tax=Dyadobacter jejuensis TaxID=1082580 RepID=A0A316AI75_9BACT|nr:M12 family metallopeptidase [Dyadobacter jejuensis]PWJ57351.1 astacin (peptidase family M12A) [Dyadobacter jejuensis]